MDVGLFCAYQLPDTPPQVGFEWDMQVMRWAEEYGFAEAWFSEHYTVGYERWPSPELHVAAAARETRNLRLGTAANLIPYHNPVALAYRLMALDHMTNGRLMVGFGAGGYETDGQLFGTDIGQENHEKLQEGAELIKAIWNADGPLKINGKHYSVDIPALDESTKLGGHWHPLTPGGPRTALVGFSPRSSSLRAGGARGDIPMSICFSVEYLQGHWEVYEEGALAAGRTPTRKDWRVVRDVWVADTDEQALELALSQPLKETWDNWVIPRNIAALKHMIGEDVDITAEFFAHHGWIVGSPDTVIAQLKEEQEESGGFGTLLTYNYDFHADPEPFRRHLELLGTVVMPALKEYGTD
ncbi:LLM class flavin-dependent oxidoreductase [Nocardioides sp. CER19]|uniref:LLM class flavin-dependent oxidoreductase n=1 Tax=Nocardioides sp. CER19 TaxID=3038538 RepID=UPI0024489CE9|nr:LLM class flavin-dependent oxidoreductase [Nocardioides sp. CER19]MDH2416155.1 LLM class flavin-dependent oxidoreductase [Nocardioides sp. CER19]